MKRFKCTFAITGSHPYKIEFTIMSKDRDGAVAIAHKERMDLYSIGHMVAAFYFLSEIKNRIS